MNSVLEFDFSFILAFILGIKFLLLRFFCQNMHVLDRIRG